MAGHSKFKNIVHRKKSQDKKRSQITTRITKIINVLAQGGVKNSSHNYKLKNAIHMARQLNIPKSKIQNALIKNKKNLESYEIQYQGYSSSGIAMIIIANTNNKNRTTSTIRAIFNKNYGKLVKEGTVSYLFQKMHILYYNKDINTDILQKKLSYSYYHQIYIDNKINERQIYVRYNKKHVKEAIIKLLGEYTKIGIGYYAINKIKISHEDYKKTEKLISQLNTIEDIQNIYSNMINDVSKIKIPTK